MSALNAFARADAAWLLADTAGYDHFGRITMLTGKCCGRDDLHMAIGHAGRISTDAREVTSAWLSERASQLDAIAGLPALLRTLADHDAEAFANGAGETCGPIPSGLRLVAAIWDLESQSAKCVAVSNRMDLGAKCLPGTLRPIKTMFSPPVYPDPWPGHSFEPSQDAKQLAELQRRVVIEDEKLGPSVAGMSRYRVGGAFEAWRVSASGVERFEIACWDDRVGRVITPAELV